jgi:hypothetical protein
VDTSGPGIRRLCVAVDLERYSRRDNPGQQAAQAAMVQILRDAAERGAIDRAQWFRQQQGDGELALLPPGIDEARVITSLVRELRTGLFQHNRHANAAARLRLRVAVHQGITHVAANGFAGEAVNTVCRLCDSAPAKTALQRHGQSDLVLIVSQAIYEDVIAHDVCDVRAREFSQVTVELPDKDFSARAWIYVPDRDAAPGHGAPDAPAGTRASAEGAGAAAAPEAPDTAEGTASLRVTGDGNVLYPEAMITAKYFTGRDRIGGPPDGGIGGAS